MGGVWEPQPSVIRNLGLEVSGVVYSYCITCDIKCLLSKERLPQGTKKGDIHQQTQTTECVRLFKCAGS